MYPVEIEEEEEEVKNCRVKDTKMTDLYLLSTAVGGEEEEEEENGE